MMKYLIIPLILLVLLISSKEVNRYFNDGILHIEGKTPAYWERELHLTDGWVVEVIVSTFPDDSYRVGWAVLRYYDDDHYAWLNKDTALDTIVMLSDKGYKFMFVSTPEVFWVRIYSVDTGQKLLDRAYRHNADSRPYIYEVYDVHEVISK